MRREVLSSSSAVRSRCRCAHDADADADEGDDDDKADDEDKHDIEREDGEENGEDKNLKMGCYEYDFNLSKISKVLRRGFSSREA